MNGKVINSAIHQMPCWGWLEGMLTIHLSKYEKEAWEEVKFYNEKCQIKVRTRCK